MTMYDSLNAAIVGVLEGISGVGTVHNRLRYVSNPSAYLDLFKSDGTINAWLVTRESVQVIPEGIFGEARERHVFVLQGFRAFVDSDSSYTTMQALCDTVRATFNNQTTLGVSGVIVRGIGPCAMRSFETGQFGSVLCHLAQIEVPIDTLTALGVA